MFYQLAIWYLRCMRPLTVFNIVLSKWAAQGAVDRYVSQRMEKVTVV